jgi:MFS family permease
MNTKKKAWIVWGAAYLMTLVVCLNQFTVVPVMVPLMETFKMSRATGGWLMSVFTIGGVVLAIPAAMIMKRFGVKNTGILTLVSVLVGAVIVAIANSVPLLMIGRMIEGIALGLVAVLAPATIAMWFKSDERGLPMGLWATFAGIAFFVILNLANPLVTAFGLKGVWWFGAAIALVALIVWWLFGEAPQLPPSPQPGEAAPPAAESLGRAMMSPASWVVALMFFMGIGLVIGYTTWLPTYLVEAVKIGAVEANFLTSLISLASIPVAIITGWLLDRVPQRKIVPICTFLVTAIVTFWAFKITNIATIPYYLIFFALVSYPMLTICFTLAPDSMKNPANAPLAIGIATMGQNLGMFVFPPLVGSMIDRSGYGAASLLLVAAAAIGMVVSLFVKTYRSTPKEAKVQKPEQEAIATH